MVISKCIKAHLLFAHLITGGSVEDFLGIKNKLSVPYLVPLYAFEMAERPFYAGQFVDIVTINELKLVVFPNFIVIGEAFFDQKYQKVKFLCETSLKISERSILNWFKFLKTVYNYFYPSDENKVVIEDNKNFLIYSEETVEANANLEEKNNCFYYKTNLIDNQAKCVTVTSTNYGTPIHFSFKNVAFMELYRAFSSVFFKIYGYTSVQNLSIETFIKSSSTTSGLIKRGSFKDILSMVKTETIIELTNSECFKITELIVRHRNILLFWKESTFFFLEEDEDDSENDSVN